MTSTVLAAVADAFMSIGASVLVLSAIAAWASKTWASKAAHLLESRAGLGPLAGALVTMPPGCFGVVGVSVLYNRGRVTYGTLLAAFVATMGDSAWLLLATHPLLAVQLKLLLLVIGTIVGCAADLRGARTVAHGSTRRPLLKRLESAPSGGSSLAVSDPGPWPAVALAPDVIPGVSERGKATVRPSLTGFGPGQTVTKLFWSVGCLAAVLSLPVTLRIIETPIVPSSVYTGVGVAGFVLALTMMCRPTARGVGAECGSSSGCRATGASIRSRATHDAAQVTVWAGLALAAWDLLDGAGWIHVDAMPFAGLAGVLLAAALGLVPACSLELAAAALFVAGGLPLPAFVAYLISQDGSGFIPLAMGRPRAALVTTALTTVIAVVVGLVMLMFI